jgi:ribosome-binding factor A
MKHNMPSQRQLRVGEQVRHVVSETIQRGKFHEAILMDASDITVNEVRVSPDLKQAKAYVSSILHEDKIDEYIEALNNSAPLFQKELGNKLDMKFTPRIKFVHDTSQQEVSRLEKIFDELPEYATDNE